MHLFKQTDVRSRKILVMAGHAAGILTFGKDLEEAFTVLMGRTEENHMREGERPDGRLGPPVALTVICVDVR
jgi:hypothetical protein